MHILWFCFLQAFDYLKHHLQIKEYLCNLTKYPMMIIWYHMFQYPVHTLHILVASFLTLLFIVFFCHSPLILIFNHILYLPTTFVLNVQFRRSDNLKIDFLNINIKHVLMQIGGHLIGWGVHDYNATFWLVWDGLLGR